MKSEPDASSREPDEVLSGIVSVRAFACEVPSVKFGLVGFVNRMNSSCIDFSQRCGETRYETYETLTFRLLWTNMAKMYPLRCVSGSTAETH